jgi:cob(I)alamin adenosyltransferase
MPEGLPTRVPEDGLTTRQRRAQPLLAVHTGAGKGKSTAAFGMALRAWHAGWPVAVYQFIKGPKWRTGEEAALRVLGEHHERTGQGAPVVWNKLGEGWLWLVRLGEERDHAAAAAAGWAQVKQDLAEQRHRFYVLDELTYPMVWGWIDTADVVATLRERSDTQHVVVTGRNAPPELLELADLVTETRKIKHPMDAGRLGQQGIEW